MKNRKIMTIALYTIGLIALILIIGKINLYSQFKNEVRELFLQSKNISAKVFIYKQLDSLPAPVQRYFKHVLKEGQPYISYVRLTHDGLFKTAFDKDWIKIEGEQYFTTEKPGFIWRGTTTMFTARDMYIADKGRLVVSLFALYKIADAQGEKYDEGELQRWIAESVWFPTNLLPSDRFSWQAIDDTSARLNFNYKNVTTSFIVRFNNADEIKEMESLRYMGEEKREKWLCTMSNYKEIKGVVIPTSAEVLWQLEKGDMPYAKFNVKKIEFDTPQKF